MRNRIAGYYEGRRARADYERAVQRLNSLYVIAMCHESIPGQPYGCRIDEFRCPPVSSTWYQRWYAQLCLVCQLRQQLREVSDGLR